MPVDVQAIKNQMAVNRTRTEAKAHMQALIALTNNMSASQRESVTQGMLEAIQQDHRTLQQGFVGCLHDMFIGYSKSSYDLRNESAVQYAKDVTNLNPTFPFI